MFLITTSVRCTFQMRHVGCLVAADFLLEQCQLWLCGIEFGFLTRPREDVVLLRTNWLYITLQLMYCTCRLTAQDSCRRKKKAQTRRL